MKPVIRVDVLWDEEAKVYVATSSDVPGLVSEASTFEELQGKVMAVVPELLHDNAAFLKSDTADSIEMCLLSKFSQNIQMSA